MISLYKTIIHFVLLLLAIALMAHSPRTPETQLALDSAVTQGPLARGLGLATTEAARARRAHRHRRHHRRHRRLRDLETEDGRAEFVKRHPLVNHVFVSNNLKHLMEKLKTPGAGMDDNPVRLEFFECLDPKIKGLERLTIPRLTLFYKALVDLTAVAAILDTLTRHNLEYTIPDYIYLTAADLHEMFNQEPFKTMEAVLEEQNRACAKTRGFFMLGILPHLIRREDAIPPPFTEEQVRSIKRAIKAVAEARCHINSQEPRVSPRYKDAKLVFWMYRANFDKITRALETMASNRFVHDRQSRKAILYIAKSLVAFEGKKRNVTLDIQNHFRARSVLGHAEPAPNSFLPF